MSQVLFRIAISLDGFTAGPGQGLENPIGAGGMRLHEWVFPLRVWREMHGQEGGEANASSALLDAERPRVGATIMGRNMFAPVRGAWDAAQPWNGWWGPDPPFHHDVFVLTHHARASLPMQGGTTFHFVTGGIEPALAQARAAAGAKDVLVAGGANTARQFLAAGLLDEMILSQVPILLGAGERLFDGIPDLGALRFRDAIPAPGVTHLRFARA